MTHSLCVRHRWISRATVVTLGAALCLTAVPVRAQWHTQELPGMKSGKDVAIDVLILAGTAVVGVLVYKRWFAGKRAPGLRAATERIEFRPDARDQEVVMVNTGDSPVRIVGVELARGRSTFVLPPFQTGSPVLMQPGDTMALKVTYAPEAKNVSDDLVVTWRFSAAEKARTVRVRLTGRATSVPVTAIAGGRQ